MPMWLVFSFQASHSFVWRTHIADSLAVFIDPTHGIPHPVHGNVARRAVACAEAPMHHAASGHDTACCIANDLGADLMLALISPILDHALVPGNLVPIFPCMGDIDVVQASGAPIGVERAA